MIGNKGITVIALVVSIVVIFILLTVTITMAVNDGGLFNRAKQAKEITEKRIEYEEKQLPQDMREYVNRTIENMGG